MLHLTVKAPLGVPRASSHSLNSICPSIVYGPIWLTMTLMSCHYPPSPVWFASPPPLFPPSSQGGQSYQVAAQETKERCTVYQVASGVCDAAPSPTAAVVRCEASGSSQSVSLYCPQQVRQRRCRAKTRESPGYVVTGDAWTRK